MNFYRIKITAWRDRVERQAAAKRNAEVGELDAEIAKLEAQLKTARATKGTSAEQLKALDASLAGLADKRAQTLSAEETQALGVAAAAGLHPMVGKEGYQVIDEQLGQVVRLVDADGNDLARDAACEYDLIEIDAPAPTWAAEKLAQWFPKESETPAIQR